jgi:hypothetical protein
LYSEIAAQRCACDAAWFNAELPAGRPRDAAAANAQRAACCAACTNMLLCPDEQTVRIQALMQRARLRDATAAAVVVILMNMSTSFTDDQQSQNQPARSTVNQLDQYCTQTNTTDRRGTPLLEGRTESAAADAQATRATSNSRQRTKLQFLNQQWFQRPTWPHTPSKLLHDVSTPSAPTATCAIARPSTGG